jgi:hypothetical protein
VIFGGILSLDFSGGTYAAGVNLVQMFANTGGLPGDFGSVVWTGLAGGQSATFDASTGYVSINAVSEPSTLALMAIGTGCVGMMRWRKRRATKAVAGGTGRRISHNHRSCRRAGSLCRGDAGAVTRATTKTP